MGEVVVLDTGPLIALAVVGLLPTLNQLFDRVYVPDVVYNEAVVDMTKSGASDIMKLIETPWFYVEKINLSEEFKPLVELLDDGEVAAIALAQKNKSKLLMDERKGRKLAENHYGITVIGKAAVLIKAKRDNLIASVKPLLEKLIVHGYRFSPRLIRDVLERCGE